MLRRSLIAVAAFALGLGACSDTVAEPVAPTSTTQPTITPTATTQPAPTTTTTATTLPPSPTTTTTLVPDDGLVASQRSLEEVATISGPISPKSVVGSGTGLFFAQNMMYRVDVAGSEPVEWQLPGEETVTVLLTGDMLPHYSVSQKAAAYGRESGAAFDFRPMFDQVRDVIRAADLAICHQEVQLGVPGTPISTFPRFAAPAEFAFALADAGFDGCSTASNHATDHGNAGLVSTIETLDAAGVGHTGTAAVAEDAGGIIYELADVAIGHLSYTYAVQSHYPEHPWSVNLIDAQRIVADAEALKERGAEFVIVSMHWGQQYRHQPTNNQRRLAGEIMASSAVDLIVGHHAHVLQPIEYVNEKPVIFGLGNFLSNQGGSCCGGPAGADGAAVLVRLRKVGDAWKTSGLSYMPTWVHRHSGGFVIWPAVGTSDETAPLRHLEASQQRSSKNLTIAGGRRPGLSAENAIGWLTIDQMRQRLAWVQ